MSTRSFVAVIILLTQSIVTYLAIRNAGHPIDNDQQATIQAQPAEAPEEAIVLPSGGGALDITHIPAQALQTFEELYGPSFEQQEATDYLITPALLLQDMMRAEEVTYPGS